MDNSLSRHRAVSVLIVFGTILVMIATWNLRDRESN
jgi:hypothetical protein